MRISVVVTTYNGRALLGPCIESLLAQTRPLDEIVIVDDASPDGDASFVHERFPPERYPAVRTLRLPQNLGHAGAAAAGVAATRGELVVLVNNDAAPDPDWLEQALPPFDDPRVGSVATRLVRADAPDIVDSAGDGYTVVGHAFKGRDGERDPQEKEPREVFSACAAAVVLRRAAYDAAGGLRPELQAYYDDVDLGFRLRLAGYTCVYVPAARCRHRVSASYGRGSFRQLALTSRNQAFMWWADMPTPLLVRYLPEHALFFALQVVSRLFQGGLLPLLAGKAQALAQLPLVFRLRRDAQSRRRTDGRGLLPVLDKRWLGPGVADFRRHYFGSRRQQLDVLRELAWSDFRLKYHDSVLGYLWSMLSPLLMFAVFYAVFHHVLGVRVPDYMPYLAVGLVYWAFFQDCTSSGITSLAGKAGLMKAVRVSPLMVLTAAALSTVITLVVNTTLLVVGLGLAGRLTWRSGLALAPLAGLVFLATGVSFIVALAYARFRDVAVVWPVLLQALFWLTPVTYRVAPQTALWEVVHLNPVARCLSLLRWLLVYDLDPPLRFVAVSLGACVLVFAAGLWLVRRFQATIPESL